MSPRSVAIRFEGQTITYARLAERVAGLVGRLRTLGVRRGDRVAYLGRNHPSFLEVFFATGSLGAVFVPLSFRLATPELDELLADCTPRVLVHGDSTRDRAAELDRHGVRVLSAAELDDVEPEEQPSDEVVTQDDVCVILYTSGTTGKPKGAVLTHGNLTWNSVNVLVENDLTVDERALVVAPLFHAAALNMVCLPVLLKGGTVVLVPSFDPDAVLDLVERERVTLMFGVPTMFEAMAAQPRWRDTDFSSVRHFLCGGAPLRATTLRRYLDRGLPFGQGYGMTEAAAGVLKLDHAHFDVKAGSVGVPSFFTDVRVDGNTGEPGELLVSGPTVMRGYWGRPDATDEVLDGDWLRTGDVATVDPDGYHFIVDRTKNVIISGGENVYPAEVEAALAEIDGVTAAVVVGVPDERWGEVGRAVVVVEPGAGLDEDAVLARLRTRLAGYKVPRSVRFVDHLPTTPTGKIARAEVRRLSSSHAR